MQIKKIVFLAATFAIAPWMAFAQPAVKQFQFTLKKPGKLSAAVYDAQGHMVRELLRAQPWAAGTHQISWDGLDLSGQPAPPGQYTWKTLSTQGLHCEYLMSVGTSVGSQWTAGNHTGTQAMAVAEDSFVAGAASEGPPDITRTGYDGKVWWTHPLFEPARTPRDVVIAGGKVYYLLDNGKIYVLDYATGKDVGAPLQVLVPVAKHAFANLNFESGESQAESFAIPNGQYFLRFNHGDPARDTGRVEVNFNGQAVVGSNRSVPEVMAWWQLPITEAGKAQPIFLPQIYRNPYPVNVDNGQLEIKFIPEVEKDKPVHWRANEVEVFSLPGCLAVQGDQLVVASAGTVMWLEASTGKIQDTATVPGVVDIALGADGTVFALTKTALVTLSKAEKTPVQKIGDLKDASRMTLDPATGDILIVDGGEGSQVKRYSSEGKSIGTYGRPGGRRLGPYESADFRGVTAISPDGHGGFVVAEDGSAPRRVARFDREGKCVKEWFGPMGFYGFTCLDPTNPRVAWQRLGYQWLVKVELDYASKSWKPLAAYNWQEKLDPAYFPPIMSEYLHMRCLRRDINGDGVPETLLWTTAVPGLVLVEDEKNRVIRPLAAMGDMDAILMDEQKTTSLDKLPKSWKDGVKAAGGDLTKPWTRRQFCRYSWADANGDGEMQGSELQLGPELWGQERALRIDEDMTLWQGGGNAELFGIYRRYKPARFTTAGAPVWELNSGVTGPKTPWRADVAALRSNAKGDKYILLREFSDGIGVTDTSDSETHAWGWPANLLEGCSLQRLDAKDNLVWQSGPKAARWPHPRGQIMAPRNINGFVKDSVAVGDQVEQPCEFWTEDGLYVGGLFDGRDPMDGSLPGGPPDRLYTWLSTKIKKIGYSTYDEMSMLNGDDMLMGGDLAELPDGSVIFVGHAANNSPCYRITGWDGWERSSGKITVAAPSTGATQKGTGLKVEYFSSNDFTNPLKQDVAPLIGYGAKTPWPAGTPSGNFSARWTGFVEPLYSERYTFSVYFQGECKLWVDDKEVEWAKQDYPYVIIQKRHSMPISLKAGVKVPIRLEYAAPASGPVLHLNWESLSQQVQRIPAKALYSEP